MMIIYDNLYYNNLINNLYYNDITTEKFPWSLNFI